MQTTPPNRRWFQFSLRTLLIAVTLMAAFFGWFVPKYTAAQRQHAAIAAIRKLSGVVRYRHGYNKDGDYFEAPPSAPAWLRRMLGDDLFQTPVSVDLPYLASNSSGRFPQETLEAIVSLQQLQQLNLAHTNVGDADLQQIASLRKLIELDLSETQITNAGLQYLASMPRLQYLDLSGNYTTATTGENLGKLRQLKFSLLRGTELNDLPLTELSGETKATFLELGGPQQALLVACEVKQAALEEVFRKKGENYIGPLWRPTGLGRLETKVTDAGLERLENITDAEFCALTGRSLDDSGRELMEQLRKLSKLARKDVRVNDAGIARLQQALPNCQIVH